MQLIGRRFDTKQPVAIQIEGETIASVAHIDDQDDLPWIAPGFVDLQVNGYGGRAFNDPDLTVEDVDQISRLVQSGGVSRYCPTVITDSYEALARSMRTIVAACEELPEVAAHVAGIHQEGPYLSREDGPRGAHILQHCRPPDWEEFQRLQEAANGRICILTLSPEYDGSADFVRGVVATGVVVAIGHTNATPEQILAAVDAGARLSTHLGNGAHAKLPRHHNYIWNQLANDRLVASLIVDGHHLPADVVQTFVRAKTPKRCVLVSDITSMAGMPPGRYSVAGMGDVEVLENGRLVVAGQRELNAGASFPITDGVTNVIRFAQVDLETAVHMASTWPSELINQTPARLLPGASADLVLFELSGTDMSEHVGKLVVRSTFVRGRLAYSSD